MNTYTIYSDQVGTAKALLEAYNRRAAKLGCQRAAFTFGEPHSIKIEREGAVYTVNAVELSVEVPAIRINGYTLVGSLERLSGNELVKQVVPGQTMNTFVGASAVTCQHCNSKRARKLAYVFNGPDGQIVVGSTCAKLFLETSPAAQLKLWQVLVDLTFQLENFRYRLGGIRLQQAVPVRTVLAVAVQYIEKNGYVSSADVERAKRNYGYSYSHTEIVSTASSVYQLFQVNPLVVSCDLPTAEHYAKADQLVEWIKTTDATDNDYLRQFQSTVRENDVVGTNRVGGLVGLVRCYEHWLEKQAEEAEPESNYVGTIGERRVFSLIAIAVAQFESEYGTTSYCRFKDAEGNKYLWKASGCKNFAKGEVYTGKATIKDHATYKGIRETIITRAAF